VLVDDAFLEDLIEHRYVGIEDLLPSHILATVIFEPDVFFDVSKQSIGDFGYNVRAADYAVDILVYHGVVHFFTHSWGIIIVAIARHDIWRSGAFESGIASCGYALVFLVDDHYPWVFLGKIL
jgi:hypothetical protein